MSKAPDRGLEKFDNAIVEDRGAGTEVLRTVAQEADADNILRMTESQARALLEFDRAIVPTPDGQRIVVEMIPDEAAERPVEIRSAGNGKNTENS